MGNPSGWNSNWPSGSIPYCFRVQDPANGYPQPGTTAWDETVALVEDAMAKVEAVDDATIDFYGGALCSDPQSDPSGLKIRVRTNDAVTSADRRTITFGRNYWAPEAGILHELSHIFWLNHEYSRPDSPETSTCSPKTPQEGEFGITRYDPNSFAIQTYCGRTSGELSYLDKVGLAFLHPGPNVDRLHAPFGFKVNGVLVTGANGTDRVRFLQQVQGVQERHYLDAEWSTQDSGGTWLEIHQGSGLPLGDLFPSGSGSPPSSETLRGSFVDGFERERTTAAETVVWDTGFATALLLSTI